MEDRNASFPGNGLLTRECPVSAYEEKLSTRLSEDVGRRLRLYTALRGLKINEAVNGALDRHLPSLDELANELTRAVNPAKNRRPGRQLTSEETH
jgi:hypothetical protein